MSRQGRRIPFAGGSSGIAEVGLVAIIADLYITDGTVHGDGIEAIA